jgi:Tol biopolymer transport system component
VPESPWRKSLIVACTFLASVLPACTVSKPLPQETPAAASPEPLGTEFRLMRNPVVSPDGTRIAFSHQGDISVAPLAGGMPAMRVTAQPSREDTCLWTPDGRALVFTSNRFGNNDLFVVDLVGGDRAA